MRNFFSAADVFLWRNKKISAGVLGGATALWILFELLEYHLITLVCHVLILSLAVLFLWSNASTFINKYGFDIPSVMECPMQFYIILTWFCPLTRSPLEIPVVTVPEKCVLEVASALRFEINRALAVLRDIASGRDLKKFLGVCFVLYYVLSWQNNRAIVCGSWVYYFLAFSSIKNALIWPAC